MNRYTNLHRIQQLDPRRDCHEIYRTMILVDFGGWDALMGLQLAFYSTYGVPAIAALLDQAGELLARPRKRALDTALLTLLWSVKGFSLDEAEESASGVALEAATDLGVGLLLSTPTGQVGAGGLMAVEHPPGRDGVQGAVELAVTEAIESMADDPPGGRRQWADPAERGEGGLGAEPPRM